MLKLALLVLTMNADGSVQTTVSEADNLSECQEQLETVQGLLLGMEVNIAHISCGQTSAHLTPFEHGLGPESYKYHYQVKVSDEQFALTSYEGDACVADMQGNAKIYCTISSQRLLNNELQ